MSNFYYYGLSREDRKLYDIIAKEIEKRKSIIAIPYSQSNAIEPVTYIQTHNPQYFYVDQEKIELITRGFSKELKLHYLCTEEEISSLQIQLELRITEILKDMSTLDDYEKVKQIYDLISRNVIYDDHAQYAHNIIGPLFYKKAVCQGIAYLFKYFCDKLGIKCLVVSSFGKGETHAWNIVSINKVTYHIDVTWDLFSRDEEPTYFYFCQPDAVMSLDHSWRKEKYPTCSDTQETLFKRKQTTFEVSELALDRFVTKQRLLGNKVLHFQIVGLKSTVDCHKRLREIGLLGAFSYLFDERTGEIRLNFK